MSFSHWLPVPQRIQFKVALVAFDCVRGSGPAYFTDVCIPVADISSRSNLRSAQRGDMVVPRTRTQLGRRSFHVAAPVVWNALPVYLRSISRGQFRAGLKTHLFNQAYNIVWEHFVLRVYCTYLLTYMWNCIGKFNVCVLFRGGMKSADSRNTDKTCTCQHLLHNLEDIVCLSSLVTHANGRRVSKAIIGVCLSVCLCDSVSLCVCPHDKTKTA